jgi:uncharacterized protein YndB with AHSA1/START domain/DNA-binding transcriptional ArsR family regulator
MSFPDRIERTVRLNHPPERVWQALTTAEGLGTWFGQKAEVDLRVGGRARLSWDSGDTATLTIERLEPPRVFGYTWAVYGLPEGDPRRTYVEFTLEPAGAGTTLTVVESGFAQLPDAEYRKAFPANTEGWTHEMAEPDPEAVAQEVFAALADPSRRAILAALAAGGPATATDLAARLPITRQAIAKHLALLSEAGLVVAEPGERRRVRYRLDSAPMKVAQQFLAALAHDWDDRLAALRRQLG